MRSKNNTRPHVILMIDDNPTDVLLMKEAFSFCEGKNYEIHVAEDGVYAMDFLKRQGTYRTAPRPDIILLDLNMPRKNGLEVLMAVKADPEFKYIPTLVYTSSVVKEDVRAAYCNFANGYIKKSVDFDECIQIARSINDFWFFASILYEP